MRNDDRKQSTSLVFIRNDIAFPVFSLRSGKHSSFRRVPDITPAIPYGTLGPMLGVKLPRGHQLYAKAKAGAATRWLAVSFLIWIYERIRSACNLQPERLVEAQHPQIRKGAFGFPDPLLSV